MIKEMIKDGPTFQPKLISNNDLYLKKKNPDEEEHEDSSESSKYVKDGSHFYCEAMLHLMKKQTKIIEHQKTLSQNRVPAMNEKSKMMHQYIN